MRPTNFTLPIVILLFALACVGCSSGSGDVVAPVDTTDVAVSDREAGSGRVLWGIWNLHFDPAEMKITATPARDILAHYDITDMVTPPACDDCIQIAVNSFDPVTRIIDTDVTLRNPYPIDGRDVRGILYTNDAGHLLTNPDAWTGLWDVPGGDDINPFKAFAKIETKYIFEAGAQHTENYLVYIPKPPQYHAIRFAVDASWPGNCKEPYAISYSMLFGNLYDITSSTVEAMVFAYDWQEDIDSVLLDAPEIIGPTPAEFHILTGALWTMQLQNSEGAPAGDYKALITATSTNSGTLALYNYTTITVIEALTPTVTGIDPDSSYPSANLSDVTISGDNFQGPYIQVKLKKSGEPDIPADEVDLVDISTITCDIDIPYEAAIGLYDVEVTNDCDLSATAAELFEIWAPFPDNPLDRTPEWFNFAPWDVCAAGDYAYVAAHCNGLHIFDITDASAPEWVSRVETPTEARSVDVSGDYVYVADLDGGLLIVDVSDLYAPFVFTTVGGITSAACVTVDGGYAYVGTLNNYLHVIDIDPPGMAYLVSTVDVGDAARDVAVHAGYAYVAASSAGLKIVDVDPPEFAGVVNTIPSADNTYGVAVQGDLAYVGDGAAGFNIVNINPPETALIINNVTANALGEIALYDGHAFVTGDWAPLQVIDVDPPESAFQLTTVDIDGDSMSIAGISGYAYLAGSDTGLQVLAIDPPEEASFLGTINTLTCTCDIATDEFPSLTYAADGGGGIASIIVAHWGIAFILDRLETCCATGVAVADGYAYVTDSDGGLHIIDIDPPGPLSILNTVGLGGEAGDVALQGGIAYVAAGNAGMHIIDIDPPDAAYLITTVATTDARAVAVQGNYAYIADDTDGLHIIDIDPPDVAFIYNTIPTTGNAGGVFIEGDYAYVADGASGLQIVDVNPPDLAFIAKTVDTPGEANGVVVEYGYAHIADGTGGLQIIDVDPIASAYVLSECDTPGFALNVFINQNGAYVADREGGLRVIQLW